MITWRVPPMVATTGEAYAGPSPVHRHRGLPVAASNAVSAPLFFPPMCAMTSRAVRRAATWPCRIRAARAGRGVRQTSLPGLEIQRREDAADAKREHPAAERWPAWTSARDHALARRSSGCTARRIRCARVPCRCERDGAGDLTVALARVNHHAIARHDRRRVACANREFPPLRQRRRPVGRQRCCDGAVTLRTAPLRPGRGGDLSLNDGTDEDDKWRRSFVARAGSQARGCGLENQAALRFCCTQIGTCDTYSALMASVGFVLAARIAGSRLPANVIATDTLMAVATLARPPDARRPARIPSSGLPGTPDDDTSGDAGNLQHQTSPRDSGQDLARFGAERQANAELARARRDHEGQQSMQAHSRQQTRERGERAEDAAPARRAPLFLRSTMAASGWMSAIG